MRAVRRHDPAAGLFMPSEKDLTDDFEDLDPTETDDDLELGDEDQEDEGESGLEARDATDDEREKQQDKGKEDDEDKEPYGRRAKKRIDKLVYERNVARQEAEALRSQLATQNAERAKAQVGDLESKREALKKQRRAAFDEGDLDAMDKFDDELADVAFELNLAKRSQGSGKPTEPPPQSRSPAIPEATNEWLTRNPWFFKDQARAAKARALEKDLIAEGYDSSDPDLWSELDKRLTQAPAKRTGTVSAPSRGNEGIEGGSRRISRDDYAAARMVGLDLNKPADRRAWLAKDEEL